ncbi:MAG TPA: hypothetical protein VFS43_08125 [Polyangiaceae bacterium]|nr:hypothetical protein [Polyangiaceae bacterium]
MPASGPFQPPSVRPPAPSRSDEGRRAQLQVVPGRQTGGGPTSSRWRASMAALKIPLSGVRPKPILASDVLKDEVAPLEPWAKTARWACAAAAALLLALTLGPLNASLASALPFARPAGGAAALGFALSPGGLAFAVGFGAVALLPLPYGLRAIALSSLGVGLLLQGMATSGGALHGVFSAPLEGPNGVAARTVAAVCLPAALFFRAHYRAYRGARALLALAFLLALPFIVHAVSLTELGPPWVRLSSASSLLAVAASLVGFMGAGTTALASAWALAMLAVLPLDLALRPVAMGGPLAAPWLVGVAVWALACGLSALGLFQMLASLLAKYAREVDVMRPINEDTKF